MLQLIIFLVVLFWTIWRLNKAIGTPVFEYEKESKPVKKQKQVDAYELYTAWCEKQNELPIDRVKFDGLANHQGKINLADVMKMHRELNPNSKKRIAVNTKNAFAVKKNQKKEKQLVIDTNDKFLTSAVGGYLTNSTIIGTLLGGSLLGGMFGNHLKNKKKR